MSTTAMSTKDVALGPAARPEDSSLRWLRRLLWFGIAGNLLIALLLLCWPGWLLSLLHMPEPYPAIWARHSGLILACMTLFYLPAAICPLGYFYNALVSVLARALGALFFLFAWDAYLWCVLYDGSLAVAQGWLLWRAWRNDLMSRP